MIFSRITKHKKPRYQFLHLGFNPANSCWLGETWANVTQEEYDTGKEAHEANMAEAALERSSRVQHYRDPATPLDQLTAAQRRAYEFYSGNLTLSVVNQHGVVSLANASMAGNKPQAGTVKWLRDNGCKIIRLTKNGYTGEITDQLEGLDFPPDLVSTEAEAKDPWEDIVKQNKRNQKDMYAGLRNSAIQGVQVSSEDGVAMSGLVGGDFFATMAFHGLLELEESIVRAEWDIDRGFKDPYASLDDDRQEYIRSRAELKESFGEAFDAKYQAGKASHNSCARTNLDNSNGSLFSFFLPEFHDDGTHAPVGERDVPWSNT